MKGKPNERQTARKAAKKKSPSKRKPLKSQNSQGLESDPETSLTHISDESEELLQRAAIQWMQGDWQNLSKIESSTLQFYPARAKLALFAAAGLFQCGNIADAVKLIALAQKWGASKRQLGRILISGAYNCLAKSTALAGSRDNGLNDFERSLAIGLPDCKSRQLAQTRSQNQLAELGLISGTTGRLQRNLWYKIFDRIYVVSLPTSVERRAYVSQHLKANGIDTFEWHDAYDPSAIEVKQLFADGSVQRYPPCFRCGKDSCERDDCNNVLLPAQVAVFATYLALWKKIASRGERALVVEDDVRLHSAWQDVLPVLNFDIVSGALPFRAETPCLLRLGWALGGDHDQPGPVRLENTVRMSNPCFGLTSAFAHKAISEFERVYQTADVYLHQDLPEPGQAFTVFPPIASELSWSTGEMQSQIHPKKIRVEFLDAHEEHEGAKLERARLYTHPSHMYRRQFLVTGHPRTGTGYAASLLEQLGFDVGHEKSGADGLSSWMFAADAVRYPYAQDAIAANRRSLHWDVLLHIVRNPATAVPSIMRENLWSLTSYEFRRKHILEQTGTDLDTFPENLERAIMSLIRWSQMILKMEPDFSFRLEDAHTALPGFLASCGRLPGGVIPVLNSAQVNSDKPYEGVYRPKPIVADVDWANLSSDAIEGLRWYCERFDYPLPGGLRLS